MAHLVGVSINQMGLVWAAGGPTCSRVGRLVSHGGGGWWVVRVASNSNLAKLTGEEKKTRRRRRGDGSRWRDGEPRQRGHRRAGGLGEPRVHLQHLPQRPPTLRLPPQIRSVRSAPPFYIHFPLLASIGSAAAASFHTMPSLAYPTLNGRDGTGLPCLPVLIAIRHHV